MIDVVLHYSYGTSVFPNGVPDGAASSTCEVDSLVVVSIKSYLSKSCFTFSNDLKSQISSGMTHTLFARLDILDCPNSISP